MTDNEVGKEGDILEDLVGIENIVGSADRSILIGDANNNLIIGGAGADYIDGGGGTDTVSYAASATVYLGGEKANGGAALGDVLKNVENLVGGAGNDTFTGGAMNNVLSGMDGNDELNGGLGDDMLVGGKGTDTLKGGKGNDRLVGGDGNDDLYGGDGADIFVVGNNDGKDTIKATESTPDFSRTAGDVIVLKGFSDADQTDRETRVDISHATNAVVKVKGKDVVVVENFKDLRIGDIQWVD